MRQFTCTMMAVLVAAAFACSPSERRETASSLDSTAADLSNDAEEAAKDVRDEVREYGYDRRAEFRRDVDARLERLDQEIADLERTTKRGADKARDSAVVHIRGARQAVATRLDRFGSATEATWEDVKRSISAAVDSLDLAIRAQRPDARPMGGAGPN